MQRIVLYSKHAVKKTRELVVWWLVTHMGQKMILFCLLSWGEVCNNSDHFSQDSTFPQKTSLSLWSHSKIVSTFQQSHCFYGSTLELFQRPHGSIGNARPCPLFWTLF
jgi:hypothetical protein